MKFPEIDGSANPVEIAINNFECPKLYAAMSENEPVALAKIMPGCISSICRRLISDALREDFDLNEPPSLNSSWQTNLSYVFSSWATRPFAELDLYDSKIIDDWISEVISSWATKSGNPALVISRSMGDCSEWSSCYQVIER